jgi:hypothetical protein
MTKVIHHLVDFEMNLTSIGYQYSYMLKYSIGLFFTTSLMTLVVEAISHDNVYQEHFGII